MPETNEENPNSGFSKERFLSAVNASKIKLNKKILNRQEREAKINSTSEPVAKVANDDEKMMKITRSGGRYTKSKGAVPDFPTWAESRIANHKRSKGSSFPHIDFEAKTENTLRKVSPTTSILKPSNKEELSSHPEENISNPTIEDSSGNKVISPIYHKTPIINDTEEEEKNLEMKSSEIVNKISELIDKEIPPPHIEIVTKDTVKKDDKILIEEIKSEMVNKISECESTGPVKDIENVNLGQNSVIRSLERLSPARSSLDLSLYPKHPEDNSDKIINEKLIECKVPEISTA